MWAEKELHGWMLSTRTWRQVHGMEGGETGIDDDFAAQRLREHWCLDPREKHVRAESWPLDRHELEGMVGDESALSRSRIRPYPSCASRSRWRATRPFISSRVESTNALRQAREAAHGRDIRIGGGANTIQQFLRRGLIDEMHIAISPVVLGGGERLFEGVDLRASGYECEQFVASKKATHVVLRRHAR